MHHTAYYVKDYPAYRDFIVGQGGEIIFESETEDEKGYPSMLLRPYAWDADDCRSIGEGVVAQLRCSCLLRK